MGINVFFRRFFAAVVFCSMTLLLSAEERRVSLLTCSPGEAVYELFGHTAIRVVDESRGLDIVFNYGLFSFDEPNFVGRFILGETDYILGAIEFEYFLGEYALRGSGVTEQVINLDDEQMDRVINALILNSLPANRKYRYNFLYNNCTTKARDKILGALGDSLTVEYPEPSRGEQMSFRDIIHYYTAKNEWTQFAIDLLLGAPADIKARREGAQFAPLILKDEIEAAVIKNGNVSRPFVVEQTELLLPEEREYVRNNLNPFNASLLFLLFTFVVMLVEKRKKKCYWGWDILIMGVQGLAGVVLTFMVFFSQHPAVDVNWLLIWLNPLPLIILPVYIYRVCKGRSLSILWVEIAMVALFFVASPFLPQYFPAALYPFAFAILVRSLFEIYRKSICALD